MCLCTNCKWNGSKHPKLAGECKKSQIIIRPNYIEIDGKEYEQERCLAYERRDDSER